MSGLGVGQAAVSTEFRQNRENRSLERGDGAPGSLKQPRGRDGTCGQHGCKHPSIKLSLVGKSAVQVGHPRSRRVGYDSHHCYRDPSVNSARGYLETFHIDYGGTGLGEALAVLVKPCNPGRGYTYRLSRVQSMSFE